MSKVKSINSLMAYLRDEHKISINGSRQKRLLRNIGYYHGYKGYRYINSPSNRINYRDFNEIISVNNFDMNLKALFYIRIMFIETAIKNYTLEVVLDKGKSESFNVIFTNLLTAYKDHPNGTRKHRDALKRRLALQNIVYGTLTRDYNNDMRLIRHFLNQDRNVPIWAIFERISMGEFGHFYSCLNKDVRIAISDNIGLNKAFDPEGKLPQIITYILKDLRNSVAHNDVIFDARFRSGRVNHSLIALLEDDTDIKNINFDTLIDYLILVAYLLIKLGVGKTDINRFINEFENILESFRRKVPIKIYSQIIHTDTRKKISEMRAFLKRQ